MPDRYFLDTNIMVYSFDRTDPGKAEKAKTLVSEALASGRGIVSTQVVQEFLNVALHKFKVPLTLADAKAYLQTVLGPLCEVYPDAALYEAALEISGATGYRFFDALVIAAAQRAGCTILYTEDLQHGRRVADVMIVNPFLPTPTTKRRRQRP